MSKKAPPTDDDLREAAIHVAYEFKMFRRAWGRLDFSNPSLGHNNSATAVPLVSTVGTATGCSTAKNNALNATGASSDFLPIAPSTDFLTIEVLLLHFRNLMEFFYTKAPQKDNLVLAHFYTDNPKGAVAPSWEKNFAKRCNNLLAHLTFERIDLRGRNEHHWPDLGEKV